MLFLKTKNDRFPCLYDYIDDNGNARDYNYNMPTVTKTM